MNVNTYTANLIDTKSGQRRSTNSIIEAGGWFFKQVTTYTSENPLEVNEDTKVKMVIPQGDTGLTNSKYFDLSYDFDEQKFLPTTIDDVYLVNVRYKAITSDIAGYLTISAEIPNASFNPLAAETTRFFLGANTEQFKSFQTSIFIGPEAVQDGIEVFLAADNADIEVYDYSFTITRLYSDKANGIYGR